MGLRAEGADAKVLFLPDQHLGRNTAVLKMGLTLDDCVVWDPHRPNGGLTAEQLRDAKMILWKGHCSVHGRFSAEVVDELRATIPGVQILVHPECTHEVVLKADLVGSTEFIIKTIEAAPAGSAWAIGTELNLVKRLAAAHPDKQIIVPRQDRLLLLDDEPDRPAAPRVGAGVAGRRARWSTGSRSTPRPSTGPRSRCSGCSTCRASRTRTDGLPRRAAQPVRQLEPDGGAAAGRSRSTPIRAAVRLDDPAAGGQPDARAGRRPRRRAPAARRPAPLVRAGRRGRGRRPRPASRSPVARGATSIAGRLTGPGELGGVGDEVLQHRAQLDRVTDAPSAASPDVDASRRPARPRGPRGRPSTTVREVDRHPRAAGRRAGRRSAARRSATPSGGAADGARHQPAQRPASGRRRLELLADQPQRHRHGGERVAQVVADLAGEGRQLLVGALQLGAGQLQLDTVASSSRVRRLELEQVDDPVGQRDQRPAPGRRSACAWLVVEDAQRADDDALRRHQLVGGVEAHVADHAGHERVVAEPLVEARVGDDDRAPLVQHGVAHRVLARADRGVEAEAATWCCSVSVIRLIVAIGTRATSRGHLDQRQQVPPRGGVVQDPVALDLRHSAGRRRPAQSSSLRDQRRWTPSASRRARRPGNPGQ